MQINNLNIYSTMINNKKERSTSFKKQTQTNPISKAGWRGSRN
jgi:hypothetical protein